MTRRSPSPVTDDEETYQIGLQDGYEKAVQDIDLLTGGDGEYRYCLGVRDDSHCPDADSMKARIAERFAASDRDVLVGEPTDAMIEAGRAEAFNQAHRTYGDMCRAIYLAMRDAALIPLAGEL